MQDLHDTAAARSRIIFTVSIIFLSLPLIIVSLRCFVRFRLIRAFGWDDSIMTIAVVFNSGFAICAIVGSLHGVGRKLEDFTSSEDITKCLLCWWLAQPMYIFSCILMKLSIAISLLRVTIHRWHRVILYLVMATTVVFGVVIWLLMTLQCQPVQEFWLRDGKGSCIPVDPVIVMFYVYGSIGAACDLCLGILPIFLVWKLQMKRLVKIGLCVILSLGGVVCVSSIVRLPFISMYKSNEVLYNSYLFIVLFIIESGVGIIAGSLSTLVPLFHLLRNGATSVSSSRGRKPKSSRVSNLTPSRDSFKLPKGVSLYWKSDTDDIPLVHVAGDSPGRVGDILDSSQEMLNPGVPISHSA
ncbi:hypothetical protein BGW36DRAFT_331747 [Talaromyces proteolyticus]|uniref:Rhodopsin domain-containing protein n=1 Tax=Talaromyces proteolyticus TaxID=1131652 RepID=A0AAD4L577_9EURO|nr:uncharacterized protein BGW36DRAFT_331747 [Talaromyces proteolyticus]KAH8704795.1 hypothetical protein BGW36DRAFT_331747 [Talaromyces proteolyticus]